MLDAINTTLNLMDKAHMDRDLVRSGNSIVMITAGTAFFGSHRGLHRLQSKE